LTSASQLYLCFVIIRDESNSQKTADKEWKLKFQRSPVELLPAPDEGKVAGVRFEVNELLEVLVCGKNLTLEVMVTIACSRPPR